MSAKSFSQKKRTDTPVVKRRIALIHQFDFAGMPAFSQQTHSTYPRAEPHRLIAGSGRDV
jgi:hypothetical protein